MKRGQIYTLCLIIATLILFGNCAFAVESQIDPAGYLEYTLPEGVTIKAEKTTEYILSWKPLPDIFEYHIGVFRKVEGVRGKAEYLMSANGLSGPSNVEDGSGNVYTMPFTLLASLVLDGDAAEVDLGEMIIALGPDPDPATRHKTDCYYCLVMIVPQEGKPITQLIELPSEAAEETLISQQTGDLRHEFTEYAMSSAQTTSQLIKLWVDQYPLNFEVADLAASDVDTKVHMEVAMKIALDYIMDNYHFSFDDLKRSSPQVIFSDIEDAWLVHVVPPNPFETFSINVDSETGVITYTRYGAPTG